jgi:FKBP-type peptidyl-prolyl cis-trans isomerase FklB
MYKSLTAIVGICLLVGCNEQNSSTQSTGPITNDKDKASYSIGLNMGKQIAQIKDNVSFDLVKQGLNDAYKGGELKLTDDEIRASLTEFQQRLQKAQADKMKRAAETNKKAGDTFLATNKTAEGVKTTDSGLQYKVITKGTGDIPKSTDTVVTHYKGTLIDGTEFDSSYKRGQPATFPVTGVIKGWTEALQKMTVGSKWQLFIPSDLAYGSRGAGQSIGPDSVLIFEIELLEIKKDA